MKKKFKDPIHFIPKINSFLVLICFTLTLLCVGLSYIVLNKLIINPDPTLVYRLYDNPEHNEILSGASSNLKQEDLTKFLNYVVGIFDFKSDGLVRVQNFRKFLALTEGDLNKKLIDKKNNILTANTNIKLVENHFLNVEFSQYKDNPNIILAKTTFKQVSIDTNNVPTKTKQHVTFALKKVNKKYYFESENLGGKFYGFTVVDCSTDVLAI